MENKTNKRVRTMKWSLTFPQCDIPKDEMLNHLKTKGADEIVVA